MKNIFKFKYIIITILFIVLILCLFLIFYKIGDFNNISNNGENKVNNKQVKANNKEFSFAEFPNAVNKFKVTLSIEENKIKQYKINSYDYKFHNSFIYNLKSAISYFENNNSKECDNIEKKYGKDIYNKLKDDFSIITLKYNEYTTQELFKYSSGKVLVENNGFSKQEIFDIYFKFINDVEFKRLNLLLNKEPDNYEKAVIEYQIYLIFTDYRLYIY